jgi:hypothetical protein
MDMGGGGGGRDGGAGGAGGGDAGAGGGARINTPPSACAKGQAYDARLKKCVKAERALEPDADFTR